MTDERATAASDDDDADMVTVYVEGDTHASMSAAMSPAAFAKTLRELGVTPEALEAAASPKAQAVADAEPTASDDARPATRRRR